MTTTTHLPQPGDYVIAQQYTYTSGNSSVPHAIPAGETIGVLAKIGDTEYAITDDNGDQTWTITGVYHVGESMCGGLLIRGWIGGVWSCWVVAA